MLRAGGRHENIEIYPPRVHPETLSERLHSMYTFCTSRIRRCLNHKLCHLLVAVLCVILVVVLGVMLLRLLWNAFSKSKVEGSWRLVMISGRRLDSELPPRDEPKSRTTDGQQKIFNILARLSSTEWPFPSSTDISIMSTINLPLPSTTARPLQSTTDRSLPSTNDRTLSSTKVKLFPSINEKPLYSTKDWPLPSTSNKPLLTKSDRALFTTTNWPSPSTTDEKLPSTTDGILPSTTDWQQLLATDGPLPTTIDGPLPTTSVWLPPLTTDGPIPSKKRRVTALNYWWATGVNERKTTACNEQREFAHKELRANASKYQKAAFLYGHLQLQNNRTIELQNALGIASQVRCEREAICGGFCGQRASRLLSLFELRNAFQINFVSVTSELEGMTHVNFFLVLCSRKNFVGITCFSISYSFAAHIPICICQLPILYS